MNTIITIGRQFGSCGREIGELVAKHFGIPCYDKELLAKVAKDRRNKSKSTCAGSSYE